jgi:hypothetical protein
MFAIPVAILSVTMLPDGLQSLGGGGSLGSCESSRQVYASALERCESRFFEILTSPNCVPPESFAMPRLSAWSRANRIVQEQISPQKRVPRFLVLRPQGYADGHHLPSHTTFDQLALTACVAAAQMSLAYDVHSSLLVPPPLVHGEFRLDLR